MSINKRFENIINEFYSGNKRAFSQAIGVAPTVIENIVGKRQGNPSFEVTQKVLFANENINADWLMMGKGNMLKQESTDILGNKVQLSIPNEPQMSVYKLRTDYFNEKQQIPLYEIDSAAGLTTLFDAQIHQVPLDFISVPNAPKCDGAIYVRGDSMYPILKSGDIVCYKTIFDLQNLYYGDMHLLDIEIEGDRQLTVKYVQKSDLGSDYINLVSHNGHYAPRDIHKSQVKAAALIKLSIRYNTIS